MPGKIVARGRKSRKVDGAVALAVSGVLNPVLVSEAIRAAGDIRLGRGREACQPREPSFEGGGDFLSFFVPFWSFWHWHAPVEDSDS